MSALVVVPVLVPLLAAPATVALGRWRWAQRLLGVASLVVVTGAAAELLRRVDATGALVVQAGGWNAPVGISLVADRLATIMLLVAAVMLLAVLAYAVGQPGAERDHVAFHPVYQVLAAGVALSFLTGDLFNLFVAFEVTLMASYVLLTLGGQRAQVRSGMTYVVVNLVASVLFLTTVGFVYAATGTVNLADLSGRMAELPAGVAAALSLLLLVVFGVKAAVFPLFSWLPDSYPTAPTAVTAVFAGLLTKVGVYAMIRTQTLLVPVEIRPGRLLLVVAGLTMVVGVFGAVTQNDMKRILSFHIVSQIGYMVMGLGLFTVAGLAGTVLYLIHHIVVKTSLFLVAGLVEQRRGTADLARLSGLVRSEPMLGLLFAVPALSLAGIPPFSGFVAKLALVQAGVEAESYLIVAVSLVVGLLTLFSMTKIWANVFWSGGTPGGVGVPGPAPAAGGWVAMVAATGGLVVLSLGVALASGPLYALSTRTAQDLMEPAAYIGAVAP